MNSSKQTTCIFLEKGTEDKMLLEELLKVIEALDMGPRKFITQYRMLWELQHILKRELDDN